MSSEYKQKRNYRNKLDYEEARDSKLYPPFPHFTGNADFASEYGPKVAKFLQAQLKLEEDKKYYPDNHRYAKKSDRSSVDRYKYHQKKGCCGFKDFEVTALDGEVYMLGFNYGH